jgi:hypothetical protein
MLSCGHRAGRAHQRHASSSLAQGSAGSALTTQTARSWPGAATSTKAAFELIALNEVASTAHLCGRYSCADSVVSLSQAGWQVIVTVVVVILVAPTLLVRVARMLETEDYRSLRRIKTGQTVILFFFFAHTGKKDGREIQKFQIYVNNQYDDSDNSKI